MTPAERAREIVERLAQTLYETWTRPRPGVVAFHYEGPAPPWAKCGVGIKEAWRELADVALAAQAAQTPPMVGQLEHTRGCPALTPARSDECMCGLVYRRHLQTEQTMHAAWRKRAEQAEAQAAQTRALREALDLALRRVHLFSPTCLGAFELCTTMACVEGRAAAALTGAPREEP